MHLYQVAFLQKKQKLILLFTKKEKTGLKGDSVIWLHRLVTVPEEFITLQLDTLPKEAIDEVEKRLKILFGIK